MNKTELEVLIAKSEARLLKFKEMGVPKEIIINEMVHLAKLIEARVEKEK
jgi:hypothetical protein